MQQSNIKQPLIDKYLPHNFLAEKMILSCLLINSEAIEITLQTLSIEAFYFKNHQEIYKCLIFMYKNSLRELRISQKLRPYRYKIIKIQKHALCTIAY